MITTTNTSTQQARASSSLARNTARNVNSSSNPRRRNTTATTSIRKPWKRREFPETAALQPIRKPAGSNVGNGNHRHTNADTYSASSGKKQSPLAVTKSRTVAPKYKISESRKVAAWQHARLTWTLSVDTPGGHSPFIAIVRGVEVIESEDEDMLSHEERYMTLEEEEEEEEDDEAEQQNEKLRRDGILTTPHTLKVRHSAAVAGQTLLGTTALENSTASLESDFMRPESLLLHPHIVPDRKQKEADQNHFSMQSRATSIRRQGNEGESSTDDHVIPTLPRRTELQQKPQGRQSKYESSSDSESAVECEEESLWEESKSHITIDDVSLQEFYHQDSIRKERRVGKTWRNVKYRQEEEEEEEEDDEDEDDFDEDEADDHYDDGTSLPDIVTSSPRARQQSFVLPPSPEDSHASLLDVSEAASIDLDDSMALRMHDLLDVLSSQHGDSEDHFENDDEHDAECTNGDIGVTEGNAPSFYPPRRPVCTLSERHGTAKPKPRRQVSTPGTVLPPALMPISPSQPVLHQLPAYLQPQRQVIIVERGQQQTQRGVKATPSAISRMSGHTEGDSTLENSFVLPESEISDQPWANNEGEDSDSSSSSSSFDSMYDSEMDDESEQVRRYVEQMEMTKVDRKEIVPMDERSDEESIMEYYQRDRVTTMLLALQNKKDYNCDDDESTLLTPDMKSKPKAHLSSVLRTNSQYSRGLYAGFKEGFEVDLDPNDSANDESLTFIGSLHQDDHISNDEQSTDSVTISMGSALESPGRTISTIANSETMLKEMGDSMPSIDEDHLWANMPIASHRIKSTQEKWLATVQKSVVKHVPTQTAPGGKPKKPHHPVSMDSTEQQIYETMKKDDDGPKKPKRCMSMDSTQRREMAVRGAVVAIEAGKGARKQTPPPLHRSKPPNVVSSSEPKRNKVKESDRFKCLGKIPTNPPQLKGTRPAKNSRPPQTPTERTRNSIANRAGGVHTTQQGEAATKTPTQRGKSSALVNNTPQSQNSVEQLEALTRTPSGHVPLALPTKMSPTGKVQPPSILSADVSSIPSPYQSRSEVPEIYSDLNRAPEFVQLSLDEEDGVKTVTNANVMDVETPDLDDICEHDILEKIENSKAREMKKKGNLFGGRRKATEKKQARTHADPTGHQFLDNLWSFGTNASFSDMAAKNMSDQSAYIEPSGLR